MRSFYTEFEAKDGRIVYIDEERQVSFMDDDANGTFTVSIGDETVPLKCTAAEFRDKIDEARWGMFEAVCRRRHRMEREHLMSFERMKDVQEIQRFKKALAAMELDEPPTDGEKEGG